MTEDDIIWTKQSAELDFYNDLTIKIEELIIDVKYRYEIEEGYESRIIPEALNNALDTLKDDVYYNRYG